MLRRVVRALRIGFVVAGVLLLAWLPISFWYMAKGKVSVGSRQLGFHADYGSFLLWHRAPLSDAPRFAIQRRRAYDPLWQEWSGGPTVPRRGGQIIIPSGTTLMSIKRERNPLEVDYGTLGLRTTIRYVEVPLWLLAAICLVWPVTSLLLARRRRKGRGFEVEVASDE